MFINKIGYDHSEYGINCQDFGFDSNKYKLVCDGCSEGKHSEVGAKLFSLFMSISETHDIDSEYKKLINTIEKKDPKIIKDYLCFTILFVEEKEEIFNLSYCGDGFLILQNSFGDIKFECIDNGDYPKYYAYNFLPNEYLKFYKNGAELEQKKYLKSEYQKIGVASDGIRFVFEHPELKQELVSLLKLGNEIKLKRFFNRNHSIFKDDVTISF